MTLCFTYGHPLGEAAQAHLSATNGSVMSRVLKNDASGLSKWHPMRSIVATKHSGLATVVNLATCGAPNKTTSRIYCRKRPICDYHVQTLKDDHDLSVSGVLDASPWTFCCRNEV
ncbi:uncharacterized protein LAESUDRAFT_307090 [Laetiporus sulphureus 93-53]|uniref:Uncharacterized protein n=1 Tax=Laetiporus sulphureus 93-53 TaxID=1314785 RepID=A0A165D9C2_9APHY|nr:uncharacterized protein LAESUDRAFT_307090 [Laetiporus sulphureus 93-53]KZT04373.1 hypothetical protein LAESUDRAFT_307090 [Laetiporus sulphureus 93-53]